MNHCVTVNEVWKKRKAQLEKKKHFSPPKWYSLYGKANSFSKLAADFKGTHPLIYSGYSLESHGYNALQSIVYDKENQRQLLTPLRYEDNQKETWCFLTYVFTNLCTSLMIKRFCPDFLPDFQDFYNTISVRD